MSEPYVITPSELIILEGLDNSGKTTVAKSLIDQGGHRVAYLHGGRPADQIANAAYVWPLEDLGRMGWQVVCDRWHISEMVWAQLLGRQSIVPNVEVQHEIEGRLMAVFTRVHLWHVDLPDAEPDPSYNAHVANHLLMDAFSTSLIENRRRIHPDTAVKWGWSIGGGL